jgi:hypothetical protein
MLKKLMIVIGAVVAVVVVLVVIAGVMVYIKVDKAFLTSRMSQAINRQVHIESIDVSLFSLLSGIEIKNVAISNFKTPQELVTLQGKPVPSGDLFAGMEALRFKLKILPLLQRRVELKELVLYSPVVNLVKNRQGALNIDDLIQSKKQAADRPKDNQQDKAPIKADDLPVAVAVGEIGVKNGAVNYYDGRYDQRFQIYKLTALLHDIDVDPKNLKSKNEAKVKLGMGVKTIGVMKSGSVQNFDVTIDAVGKVIPFDLSSRFLEPEAILHIAVPDGEITGLQLFKAIAAIPVLGDYLGENISFLKGKQEWKGSTQTGLDLRYKAGKAEMTNGKLDLKEARLLFDGAVQTDTRAIDINLGIVMKKEINDAVKAGLAKKIEALIRNPDVRKYVDTEKLATAAMQPLLNKDGLIDLKAKAGGATNKPDVRITQPQLGSLSRIAQDAAGNVAIEAGKGAARKLIQEHSPTVLDSLEGLLKRK